MDRNKVVKYGCKGGDMCQAERDRVLYGSRQGLQIGYWECNGTPVAFVVATGGLSYSDPRKRHVEASLSSCLRLTLTGVIPDIGLRTRDFNF
ncbi:hypothetical protein Taro_013325 [Colocasia esculenta]|uniref:Uncharacterized protein n=1 Tax=Colocasia esculenta TaxID=4460 RepID=A0A843UG41_COLES|nr:hypothetical protein [Colocasia esculenta]